MIQISVPKTEEEYWKAIQRLGDHKYALKRQISEGKDNLETVWKLTQELYRCHNMQLEIIADLCHKFSITHPDDKNPTDLKPYWDWYNEWKAKILPGQ